MELHYHPQRPRIQTGGLFRVRGDVVDVYPAYSEQGLRITFWGDEIEEHGAD